MDVSDYRALRSAVLHDPAEDLPRLVLADWFEESGEASRAQFIRAAVELARRVEQPQGFEETRTFLLAGELSDYPTETLIRWLHWDQLPWPMTDTLTTRVSQAGVEGVRDVRSEVRYDFVRGFVERVVCPQAWWLANGLEVASRAPIQEVQLLRCRPALVAREGWVWRRPESAIGSPEYNFLVPAIFDRLPGRRSFTAVYPTRQTAVEALTAACLRLARGEQCSSES